MAKVRATLVVAADEPEDRLSALQWIDEHRDTLDFVSENLGCGCCVDIWNIEGDARIVDRIPRHLLGWSEWASGFEA